MLPYFCTGSRGRKRIGFAAIRRSWRLDPVFVQSVLLLRVVPLDLLCSLTREALDYTRRFQDTFKGLLYLIFKLLLFSRLMVMCRIIHAMETAY